MKRSHALSSSIKPVQPDFSSLDLGLSYKLPEFTSQIATAVSHDKISLKESVKESSTCLKVVHQYVEDQMVLEQLDIFFGKRQKMEEKSTLFAVQFEGWSKEDHGGQMSQLADEARAIWEETKPCQQSDIPTCVAEKGQTFASAPSIAATVSFNTKPFNIKQVNKLIQPPHTPIDVLNAETVQYHDAVLAAASHLLLKASLPVTTTAPPTPHRPRAQRRHRRNRAAGRGPAPALEEFSLGSGWRGA